MPALQWPVVSEQSAVVHLVRYANGPDPVDAFLASYAQFDPGAQHELVLLCKGFPDAAALEPLCRRARDLGAGLITVGDDGFDLTAYRAAAGVLPHERLCFVNSYSTILAAGWLALLSAALDAPGVGVAAATGSWGSHRSFTLSTLGLPNGYGIPMGDRSGLAPPSSASAQPQPARSTLGRMAALARAPIDLAPQLIGFPGFPAPHVRTNAFVIERALLLSLHAGRLMTKFAAYRFEAGSRGLTTQVRDRGLEAVIVGRDGIALVPGAWPDADIFWQGDQGELLVADNQTRIYANGSPATRDALSRYAWGPRARPR